MKESDAILARRRAEVFQAAEPIFEPAEVEDLGCLLRVTGEFCGYFDLERRDAAKERYVAETVFSALDSFISVSGAYRILVSIPSRVSVDSALDPRGEFERALERFGEADSFEDQCRNLLDLFKLEMILATTWYA